MLLQDFKMFTLKYHGNIYGNIPLGGQRDEDSRNRSEEVRGASPGMGP